MVIAVDALEDVLEDAWLALCTAYGVTGCLPDLQSLFEGADLTMPVQASETVVVNMLAEIVESVGRFSPWYRMPARAFGMIAFRDGVRGRLRWVLAPEARQRWQPLLESLIGAIERNSAVLQAGIIIENLMRRPLDDDSCVTACCQCRPPRSVLVNRSTLSCGEVLCGACRQPFRPV